MSFECSNLLEAGERYGTHLNNAESIYPRLVWNQRRVDPENRLESALEFLGKWRALRFKGGGNKLRDEYFDWLNDTKPILTQLMSKSLYSVSPKDFQAILYLSSGLWERGIPPTTFGKLLHFLLPKTVLLWDKAIVRNTYGLDDDPCSFLSYQCFGWRLLRHLSRQRGVQALRILEHDHSEFAGYHEPMTRLIDHLAYDGTLAAQAISSLGGKLQAFRLMLPRPYEFQSTNE
jgi:hypothetical protein